MTTKTQEKYDRILSNTWKWFKEKRNQNLLHSGGWDSNDFAEYVNEFTIKALQEQEEEFREKFHEVCYDEGFIAGEKAQASKFKEAMISIKKRFVDDIEEPINEHGRGFNKGIRIFYYHLLEALNSSKENHSPQHRIITEGLQKSPSMEDKNPTSPLSERAMAASRLQEGVGVSNSLCKICDCPLSLGSHKHTIFLDEVSNQEDEYCDCICHLRTSQTWVCCRACAGKPKFSSGSAKG